MTGDGHVIGSPRGKKIAISIHPAQMSANQRVQRGMNRPSGKRKKNTTTETWPNTTTTSAGNRQAGCPPPRLRMTPETTSAPKVTNISEEDGHPIFRSAPEDHRGSSEE